MFAMHAPDDERTQLYRQFLPPETFALYQQVQQNPALRAGSAVLNLTMRAALAEIRKTAPAPGKTSPGAAPASLLNSGNLAALAETPTTFEHERALARATGKSIEQIRAARAEADEPIQHGGYHPTSQRTTPHVTPQHIQISTAPATEHERAMMKATGKTLAELREARAEWDAAETMTPAGTRGVFIQERRS